MKDGEVTAKDMYDYIVNGSTCCHTGWWEDKIWRWNLPGKIICFSWLCLKNKIYTWDDLFHRGWIGSNWCPLCKEVVETIQHILVECKFTQSVWSEVRSIYNIYNNWG